MIVAFYCYWLLFVVQQLFILTRLLELSSQQNSVTSQQFKDRCQFLYVKYEGVREYPTS